MNRHETPRTVVAERAPCHPMGLPVSELPARGLPVGGRPIANCRWAAPK
jgi:hypothetical protein